jgi:hypothetical protein
MPANDPTKANQLGTSRPNAFPTRTPSRSSISATEMPISTDTVEAARMVAARSAATARSPMSLYLRVVGRGHRLGTSG